MYILLTISPSQDENKLIQIIDMIAIVTTIDINNPNNKYNSYQDLRYLRISKRSMHIKDALVCVSDADDAVEAGD